MSKEYVFDKKMFLIRVIYAGFLALIVFVFGIYNVLIGSSMKYLWMFICFISAYTIITNFIAISYPEKITIDDDKISFSAFHKSHVYSRNELKVFKIKEQQLAKRMYIRVNNSSIFRGRYWIDLKAYNDYEDLEKKLLEIEEIVHPNSLKFIIKNNNELHVERRKNNV